MICESVEHWNNGVEICRMYQLSSMIEWRINYADTRPPHHGGCVDNVEYEDTHACVIEVKRGNGNDLICLPGIIWDYCQTCSCIILSPNMASYTRSALKKKIREKKNLKITVLRCGSISQSIFGITSHEVSEGRKNCWVSAVLRKTEEMCLSQSSHFSHVLLSIRWQNNWNKMKQSHHSPPHISCSALSVTLERNT